MISGPEQRTRERKESGQKLRKGLGLRLRSGKRQRVQERRQGPTQSLILRQQRGQGQGPRPR